AHNVLRAAAAQAEALPGAGPERARALWAAHAPLAEAELLCGDATAACTRLEPLLDSLLDTSVFASVVEALLAWAYLGLGQLDRAASTWERGIQRARGEGYNLALVDLLRVQALYHLRREDSQQARAALNEALSLAHSMPYPYAVAKVLLACA